MTTISILKDAWEKLEPLRDHVSRLPNSSEIFAFCFRGYNSKSPKSPDDHDDIELWFKPVRLERTDHFMLRDQYLYILRQVWTALLDEFGDGLDRVMVAIPGSSLYEPGIYPEAVSISVESFGFYQPSM